MLVNPFTLVKSVSPFPSTWFFVLTQLVSVGGFVLMGENYIYYVDFHFPLCPRLTWLAHQNKPFNHGWGPPTGQCEGCLLHHHVPIHNSKTTTEKKKSVKNKQMKSFTLSLWVPAQKNLILHTPKYNNV